MLWHLGKKTIQLQAASFCEFLGKEITDNK